MTADVIRRFEEYQRRRQLSPRTIEGRRRCLHGLALFLYPVPIENASIEDLERWLDTCDLGTRSRHTYTSIARSFFTFLEEMSLRDDNPARRIPLPRNKRLVSRPFRDDDLRFALRAADPRMRAWLALAAYQGFRCKEIAGLRREDLLLDQDPPLLIVSAPKGGHEAMLPLNPQVLHLLRVYGLPASGFVFHKNDGGRMRAETVSSYIGRYLRGLGFAYSAHQARHWFGTTLYAATKDLRLTQEMLRHANPSTTAIYVGVSAHDASAAVRALDVGEYVPA